MTVTIDLLGELSIRAGGQAVGLPASKKTRALLGYLIATGRPHPRSHLCDLLWDGPDDPRAALRWSLSKLRAVVNHGPTVSLVTDRHRIGFEPAGTDIDLLEVRRIGAMDLDRVSVSDLRRAAARFRGELLEGLELSSCYRFHEWLVAEREAARRLRVSLLEKLVDRLAADPREALPHARAWVCVEPLEERAHLAVIRLLRALGRVRDALEQGERCRRHLQHELGVFPSERLASACRELRTRPARGASRLDLPGRSAALRAGRRQARPR